MKRREFLLGLGGAVLLAPLHSAAASAESTARYFSARAGREGRYFLTAFDGKGEVRLDQPLPGRGHAVALSPDGRQVVQVARRPGRYLLVVDRADGQVMHRLESGEGRHFFGHGVFSADGRRFYTTENDFEAGRGVIGVRDVEAGYRQVAELPAHGIGPHDLKLLSDGRTLVVANGGILTHPDTPRAKLNLESMSPSLNYIDALSGELLEERKLEPALHQNSIRHLGVTADDRVCFVMQYQGSRRHRPPLVGFHRRGGPVKLSHAPEAVQTRMRNYCGSVVADPSNRWFAVSSPRGGVITLWEAGSGDYVGHLDLPDGCGIAAGTEAGEFLLSSGQGGVVRYRVGDEHPRPLGGIAAIDARWDNHMIRL